MTVTPLPVPIFGPYPEFMTTSPHFPALFTTPFSTTPFEAVYAAAYRFAATIAGCSALTPEEKATIVAWVRELANELHSSLLVSLGSAMPETKTSEPEYINYRLVPTATDSCVGDRAIVDLHEHRGRTLRAVNIVHIARIKEIVHLEDFVKRAK